MRTFTRRGVLAGGLALGGVPLVTARPNDSDTTVRLKTDADVADAGVCRLPRDVASAAGVETGHQTRLLSDGEPAVFTVAVVDGKFGAVTPGGRDRLGATGGSFRVDVDAEVVDPALDEATAAEEGGFVERLVDADATDLVALAPHGGDVEYGTDDQARRVGERLGVPAWYCAGWWPGGGAFRRWHVTSTRLDGASFPALGDLADRGFEAAVSFHGWGESHVAVGGAAPVERREAVRDAVAAALDGAFDVRLATDEARNGTDPDNVVNRVTESGSAGVQLEQPFDVRAEHGAAVADAVADALSE